MKKTGKKILKFIIESMAVVIIISAIFTTGNFIKAKRAAKENKQEQTQVKENTEQKQQNSETENKVEKVKATKEQLNTEFANIMAKYQANNEIGVVYKNMSTGYRYGYNDTKYFTAASTVKVIFAMQIYDRIRNGELESDTEVPYNKTLLRAGAGEITNNPKKESYPLDYVLQNMIQYSDNTATEMLVLNNTNSTNIKVNYLSKLGVEYPAKYSSQNMVSPVIMEAVWTKLYTEKDNYKQLIDYLKASKDSEWFKDGIKNKEIASKYGGYGTYMHDTGIVFGNQDFILLIYTNNLAHSGENIAKMAGEINELTEKYM